MKTLSGVDGAFLHLETPETPMHVASLSLFELPPGYKGRFFNDVKREIRKRLGLAGGGALLVEETEDGVILRTVAQSVAHAQALAKKYTGDKADASVDAFLARRREETGE